MKSPRWPQKHLLLNDFLFNLILFLGFGTIALLISLH